jgi:[acyl-carrier-protein] S-malonyltransferase
VHEGEHLFAVERLVVSPGAGVFARRPGLAEGDAVTVGAIIGTVGDAQVRSLFDGVLQSVVAVDGERVTAHQPVAWLRTH